MKGQERPATLAAEPVGHERHRKVQIRPAGQIDRTRDQRVVERHHHRAEARDAVLVAERVVHRLAERDADVLNQMVVIHAVAARGQDESAAAVLRERVEHVVEKLHVGRDLDRSAVERKPQIDLRFFRRALDDAAAIDQLSAPFALLPFVAAPFAALPFVVP